MRWGGVVTSGGTTDDHDPGLPDPAAAADAPVTGTGGLPDAAEEALARARRLARDRGYYPGARSSARRRVSGSGAASRDRRDPALLGDEVDRLVGERGWGGHVQVGSIVGRWADIVGSDVSTHVEPVAFDPPRLTVRADSTAWATQMSLLTSTVLSRIEAEVGAGVVTELVVHGPAGPTWRRGPLRVRGRGPRDTYG